MNLNFIQDNDKIHVQTQNQTAFKHEIILKIKLLKEDFYDYSQINPSLSETNEIFSQIVKDLYEHVTNFKAKNGQKKTHQQDAQNDQNQSNNKKKKISIPYGTLKKLQILKQRFIHCRKIIEKQNQKYYELNINRQNQKRSEVKFYKNVLLSYEKQRQYYKKQTLNLEDRVQQVEAQVKKLPYNENHQFTDFQSKNLSFQSIFKYQKKMSALKKVLDEIQILKKTKLKIKKSLSDEDRKEGAQIDSLQNKGQKNISVQYNANIFRERTDNKPQILPYGRNMIKSKVQMLRKINLLTRQKTQILFAQLFSLKNDIQKTKIMNEGLKRAILQNQSHTYFIDIQNKISMNSLDRSQRISKITKTDYMIYLKELNCQINKSFRTKQVVYRCKTLFSKSKHQKRSKSANFFFN